MASAFGHAVAAIAIGNVTLAKRAALKLWLLGIACSIIPDLDVIGFRFGIPYENLFGHRGITHSFFFSALLAIAVIKMFYPNTQIRTKEGLRLLLFFFLCTASHAILDAMTSGGKGVAFFAPFDSSRYFLPWRPIKVSPLNISSFFSEWGQKVLLSELTWIGVPSAMVIIFAQYLKWHLRK